MGAGASVIGLTDRQAQALRFVAAYTDEQGYPPTLREIGDHLGIRSTNGVGEHLGRLEVKGMLKIKPVILNDNVHAKRNPGNHGLSSTEAADESSA